MNSIFLRGPSLHIKLVFALALSVGLIVFDHVFDGFATTRVYFNSVVSPIQYLANLPSEMLNASASRLVSHQQLLEENAELQHNAVVLSGKLQRFVLLQEENDRLRRLLNTPVRGDIRKEVAELMAVDNNPYSHQIVIDRGAIQGVYEGQPVIDDKGIVGQIMQVGSTNSRVLLISDVTHAIPVRVARNNIRMIVSGSGSLNDLIIQHVPHSADVKEGDLLLSSGLGNVFPEGYPVARITSIVRDEGRPFAQINAEPVALLDRLKYLLLLWPNNLVGPEQTVPEAEQ
ncbi:rod shape-determining protein MreC [Paraglaciecola agarilytica]|uniref:rod shape-determining protein MreC n=1 Tax=Paraglaciecola chathamensis TaxID=368405 RepID=UPI001C08A70D|nr:MULTISPECIES: rod shape-determining protein MreC [Paraglaciecola]MBU3017816.1 rod shape-determining protein MreC [Paraglaciecola agarilytica]MDO6558836.1 rod shape-determining protein MreC [Paraglaciecola chathamensis]MDO6839536.1 rod shape-determining protein MreC [Paraglaciecola chathamensis]